jgi:hypothetical protein
VRVQIPPWAPNYGVEMTDLEKAVGEAIAYNRMGALIKEILEDIAFDYDLDPKDILEEMGWGRDHYD